MWTLVSRPFVIKSLTVWYCWTEPVDMIWLSHELQRFEHLLCRFWVHQSYLKESFKKSMDPWCNRTVRGESWGNVMWWIWLQIILCTESDWHPRICHMTCCIFLTHKEDFYLDFGAKTHRWKAPPAALVFDVGSMLSGDDWPWSSFSWFPPAHLSICGRHRLPGGWHWFAKGRQCHEPRMRDPNDRLKKGLKGGNI